MENRIILHGVAFSTPEMNLDSSGGPRLEELASLSPLPSPQQSPGAKLTDSANGQDHSLSPHVSTCASGDHTPLQEQAYKGESARSHQTPTEALVRQRFITSPSP
eukprot:scaffold7247_cov484-Prasinococcus_capsulatus_cf.AAC.7